MTAGKGVLHSEMFPLLNTKKDNPLEIFQVWLNLPKASKFVDPHFKMLWAETIPLHKQADSNGNQIEVNVIAGHLHGLQAPAPTPDSWAAAPEHGVAVLTIKLAANATWTLPKAQVKVNRNLYFYKGASMEVEGQTVPSYHSIAVEASQDITLRAGTEDCYLLMLQGQPINEPVAQYGPFVMNTEAEIQEAFRDYRETQFGGWPWTKQEQAHARDKSRFALHADGTEELK